MSTNCKSCNKKVRDSESGLQCDYCDGWFHPKCISISEEQYNHLKALGEFSFWFCDADKKKISNFIKKKKNDETILDEMKSSFKEIKSEVSKITGMLEIQMESRRSYSEILKMNNNMSESKISFSRPSASKGVMVVPKCQDVRSSDVEKLVKEKVKLVNIKTGVSKIKYTKNSGVFLATSADVEKLEKEVIEQLGDDFKVFKPKAPSPQLIISGISREYSPEELWHEIKETNHGFSDTDAIKVVHHRKFVTGEIRKKESWCYIIEAPPITYKKMVNRYLSVDFSDHFVRIYVDAVRCYNCQQYNHKSSHCTSPSVCSRCGQNHKTSECTKAVSFSCINCRDANAKGSKFNTNHSCGSSKCTVHQNILKAKQSRINLPEFLSC